MQVLSRCPLEVGSILWLPRSGAYTLTVVAKATFRLSPEVSQLAEEQDPVIEADSYWDHDEAKSLDSATDLVPRKRYPEVILVGHAYAPKGVAVGGLQARLTVCEIDKAIDISGDRHFKLDGTLSHPGRFAKMPLRWERAAGGPDTSNPVGVVMGEEARADGWGRVHLPNLVPSGRIIASRDDIVPPACFAPIAPSWPSRVTRLHRHAASFSPQGWFARPMPPDLDLGYFNAAPQDQHLRELLGTERFTLENLHPHYPLLTTRLASVGPRAVVDWGGGSTHEVPFTCDTLLIDTDRFVATLTFRAQVPLDYPERQGWVIVTSDAFPEVEVPSWIHDVQNPNETMAQPSRALAAMAALPFDAKQTGPQPAFERAPTALPFDAKQTGPQAAWNPGRALPFDVKTGPQPTFEPPPALPFGGAPRGSHPSLPDAVPFGDASRRSHPSLPDAVPFVEPDDEAPSFVGDPDEPAYDEEEETFASVRGDAPFPVGTKPAPVPPREARAPAAHDGTSGASVPFVPPKVPQGPRLGAFRLVTKSDAPPPAALDFTDAPTDEPGASDIDDRTAQRAAGIPTPPPMVTPQRPPMASQPDVEPPPMVRRAGTMPIPDRASDPGLPFGKGPPGKVQPGVMPPGKIAPMKPGVPPPPPSVARSEPPTFGFRGASAAGRNPDAGRADSAPDSAPFAHDVPAGRASAPGSSAPFARAQTLPTPGLYPAPAMPFGPPDEAPPPVASPAAPPPAMPQASAMMAAETLPGPMSFASLIAGPPPAATPFAQSHTPPPVATPFGSHGAPTFGAPGHDPSHGAPTFGGAADPQHAPGATPFGAPTFGAPGAEPQHAPGATPFGAPTFGGPGVDQHTPVATPFGAPLGGLGAQQGMTIGERIPAARASAQGKTIGEMVAQQRLPIESPSAVGMAPLGASHSAPAVGMAPLGASHSAPAVGMAPLGASHTTSGVGMAPLGAARAPIDVAPESMHDAAPHADVAPPALVEPPRIGPLATPEMVVADLGLPPPSEESPPSSDAPKAAPPPPAPAEPEPLPLDKYPLERCAKIAASVARTREKKTEILEAHKLDEATWEPLRTHWLDEIKKETERGKTEKLKAYDGAFVGQLEEERGPIAVEEYARIVIAAERGTTNATLQELGLPEGSMLRIQRVWMAKMGKDPELRRLVQSAVEAASES